MVKCVGFAAFASMCLCLSACGTDPAGVEQSSTAANAPPADKVAVASEAQAVDPVEITAPQQASIQEKPADQPPAWKAEDEPLRTPATISQAAAVLDLRTFPVLENAELPSGRSLSSLNATVKATAKEAVEFFRGQLLAVGFRAIDNRGPDDYSGGMFFRDGFLVSLMVSPAYGDDSAGKHSVFIHNHGNVNTHKLPVPEGMNTFYGTPIGASYITEAAVEETSAAVAKLLLAQGWQPYGAPQGSLYFKQNAVRLMASIQSAPAQGGKTIVTFHTEQLSADLPAPPNAENIQYSDSTKDLRFDFAGSATELAAHYQQALEPGGWKSTTENPVELDFSKFMIFRNPAQEMLELKMRESEEKQSVSVTFRSAEEVAEIDRLERAKIAEMRAKTPPAAPKLALALPAELTDFTQTATSMEFSVKAGQAKASVQAIVANLKQAGWKEMDANYNAMFGNVTLINDSQTLSLTYVDTPVVPPQVNIMAFGLEIERAKE